MEAVNTTATALASDISEMTGMPGASKPTANEKNVKPEAKDPRSIRQVQAGFSTVVLLEGGEFNFLQNTHKGMILDTWLLLDSQSTCGVIKNK